MATTTFSGPVKAGNIFNRTGNTLGENVANQGQATMVQVDELYETSDDPSLRDIVIPANSQIIRIAVLTTTAFASTHSYVGKDRDAAADANEDSWFAHQWDIRTLGLHELQTTGGDSDIYPGFESHWKDTGPVDLHVTFYADNVSEPGQGVLIMEYIQNNNLTA